jgi:DNA-binding protein HU-beta
MDLSPWHLYLLECEDGSLYAGIAKDVTRRFEAHRAGKGGRYTRSHPPRRLVGSRSFGSKPEALRAELAIKRLPRPQKILALQAPDFPWAAAPTHNDIVTRRNCMNKSELIDAIAKDADLPKAAADRALSAAIDAVVKAVAKGDTVTLVGFGTFKSSKRAARTGRNPQTGKEIKIAATTVPRFTAGASFKAAVAGKKAKKK